MSQLFWTLFESRYLFAMAFVDRSWSVPLFNLRSQVSQCLAKGEVYHYLIDSIAEAISFVDDYNMIPEFLPFNCSVHWNPLSRHRLG